MDELSQAKRYGQAYRYKAVLIWTSVVFVIGYGLTIASFSSELYGFVGVVTFFVTAPIVFVFGIVTFLYGFLFRGAIPRKFYYSLWIPLAMAFAPVVLPLHHYMKYELGLFPDEQDDAAHFEELERNFIEHRTSFLQLKNFIQNVRGIDHYLTISHERIGDHLRRGEEWSDEDLREAVDDLGLNSHQYREYMKLLDEIRAKRLTYSPAVENTKPGHNKKSGTVEFLVASTGFVFGGCSTEIRIHTDGLIPQPLETPGFSIELLPLGGGWYVEHSCS